MICFTLLSCRGEHGDHSGEPPAHAAWTSTPGTQMPEGLTVTLTLICLFYSFIDLIQHPINTAASSKLQCCPWKDEDEVYGENLKL